MNRRNFIELGAAIAALRAGTSPAGAQPPRATPQPAIDFIWDGRMFGATQHAQLLMRLADEGRIKPDFYSYGVVVEELEARFAPWLGHERGLYDRPAINRLTKRPTAPD